MLAPVHALDDPAAEPAIQYHAPINQWAEEERPREKLMQRGASALTDAELIAIIFGSGTRTKAGPISAVQLAQALLRTYPGLHGLSQRSLKECQRVIGIGPAKAIQLAAAFEIGRRVEASRVGPRVQVCAPADVAAVYGPQMRDLPQEVFKVVMLNTANVIIGDYTASSGGLAASIVEPRQVFKEAILENAASVICLHNHPSGNPEPSPADIRITRQLVEAGKLLSIPVHDHLIIAGRTYTSFAERKLI
ncbi:MAG: DNA repair protein RadC [Bacteroidota bacterium]